MYKLIAMYRQPADVAAFEKHYREVHLPLVERIPGLQQVVINRGVEGPVGEPPYYQTVEMHFANEAAFETAWASPENAAAGKDVQTFAANLVTLMVARVD